MFHKVHSAPLRVVCPPTTRSAVPDKKSVYRTGGHGCRPLPNGVCETLKQYIVVGKTKPVAQAKVKGTVKLRSRRPSCNRSQPHLRLKGPLCLSGEARLAVGLVLISILSSTCVSLSETAEANTCV